MNRNPFHLKFAANLSKSWGPPLILAIVHHGILDESVLFIGKLYSPSVLAKKIREVLDKVR